jgi:hypothetical protein
VTPLEWDAATYDRVPDGAVVAVDGSAAERPPYGEFLGGMPAPWRYETPRATEQRLRASGFGDVRRWSEPKPTVPGDAAGFLRTVLLNYHVERLPDPLVEPFLDDVLAACGEPLRLEYVRLNIEAVAA